MLALLLGVLFPQQFDRIRAAEFAEKALLSEIRAHEQSVNSHRRVPELIHRGTHSGPGPLAWPPGPSRLVYAPKGNISLCPKSP